MAAAAAYAALVSLMNVLTRYQHPTCPVSFDQSQIQTLLEKVSSLVEFLEIYYYGSRTSRGSIQDLESKMTSAAHAAEDMIESYYVKRVLDRDGLESCPNLQNPIQEMDLFIQESMDCRVKRRKNDHQEEHGTKHEDPSGSRPRDNNFMVGFDEQLSRLMDRIRTHNRSRVIIPIVGMGGMGKTTLATNAYNLPYVVGHFDIRAWVTISQRYVVKDIIISLLRDIKGGGNDQNDNVELGDQLYQGLWGRKYLIILDDIWSCEAWFEIMRFFPDNSNGSRILLTTRLCSVARRVGPSSTYEMEFLDDDESFNLLSKMAYGLEVFPRELEIVGKAIAKSCKGLPLTIVVIGGVLKMCSKTSGYWKDFAENLSSIISEDNGEQCLGILSLSYSHLPIHLKPCFLHMAAFEEDKEIDVSNLVNLWVAEGFLKPTKDRLSNEIALEYLNDLIDRNLIMVGKRGLTVHDLLRELCLREAQNDNFTCVIEADTPNLPQRTECERRIIYKNSTYEYSNALLPTMPHARCLYVTGYRWRSMQLASVCGLLRMMSIMNGSELQMDFVQPVNIRYLAVAVSYGVRNWLLLSLSLFWNLETLILTCVPGYGERDQLILPSKIWEFPNLRHIEFKVKVAFLYPTSGQINCVLNSLQTIRTVGEFFCTDEVFRLIPNLKELSIEYDMDEEIDYDKLSRSFTNLALLRKLERLSVTFWNPDKWALNELDNLTFSPYLRELRLCRSEIPWENMTIVGSLPNLQVLELHEYAFCGNEWDSIDGEFERLKYLSISCCPLSTWKAESCHFPRLEHLKLHQLDLDRIPSGIGEIPSLETIELRTKKMSTVNSAKEILDERKNQGDADLFIQVLHYGGSDKEKAELNKWAEADDNFKIKSL